MGDFIWQDSDSSMVKALTTGPDPINLISHVRLCYTYFDRYNWLKFLKNQLLDCTAKFYDGNFVHCICWSK